MSAVVNVFASIGLIAILIVIIYYIWKYIDKLNKDAKIRMERPSSMYMKSVGIKCPDYWMYKTVDKDGNYICQDVKGLMSQYEKSDDPQCILSSYTDANKTNHENVMLFSKLDDTKDWNEMSDDEKIDFMKESVSDDYYSRAEWIKSCGPAIGNGVSTQAVWSGLNKYV